MIMNINYDWIHDGAGMVYMKKGRYKAAEDKFRQILSINPSYSNACAQLGLILKNDGRKEEAKEIIEKALCHGPNNDSKLSLWIIGNAKWEF